MNAIAMIYQSSNNCKIETQYKSKSVGKGTKKNTTNNVNISLDKRKSNNLVLKTEGKGFYDEIQGQKMTDYETSPAKNS